MIAKKRWTAIGVALIILVLMSVDNIFIKIALSMVSPFAYVWMSLLIGMIALAVYTFGIKKERIPFPLMSRRVWLYILQIGFFNFFTGRMSILSLNYLSASTNSYINNFIGFITMGMSCVILKEKPTIFQMIGSLIAFAGLRVFFPAGPQGGECLGIALVLISITGIAYTNNIARKLAQETDNKISNTIISTLALLMGGLLMVVTSIIIDGFPPMVNGYFPWIAILFTGISTNAFGMTAWNGILRTLRSYEASVLGASMVIWVSLLAFFILGERITMHQILGIAMQLVGIGLVQVRADTRFFRKNAKKSDKK